MNICIRSVRVKKKYFCSICETKLDLKEDDYGIFVEGADDAVCNDCAVIIDSNIGHLYTLIKRLEMRAATFEDFKVIKQNAKKNDKESY